MVRGVGLKGHSWCGECQSHMGTDNRVLQGPWSEGRAVAGRAALLGSNGWIACGCRRDPLRKRRNCLTAGVGKTFLQFPVELRGGPAPRMETEYVFFSRGRRMRSCILDKL